MIVQNPLVAAFAAQVGKRYSPAWADTFWTCEPLFRLLLDPQVAEAVINERLQALVDDPAAVGSSGGPTLQLAQGAAWTLSLRLLTQARRYLHSTVRDTLVAPIGSLPLRLDRYQLPDGFRDAVFDPAQRLSRAGSISVAPGELLRMPVAGLVFDYRIEAPLLILMLESAPQALLEWRFSRDSLHAWQCTDADPDTTDLKAAAWLAGRLAHHTSLKPLQALAAHPNPGVRGAALQNIGRLSRSLARKLLNAALDDPHPQVRLSARQALDRDDPAPSRQRDR